jgi:Cytochrome c7 and related cytochrome c
MPDASSTLQALMQQRQGAKQIRRRRCVLLHAVLAVLMLLSLHQAPAQISPGPLARAHQSFSGDANCTKCHELSAKAPTFRCLECHKEIAAEIQQNRGLHATFPRSAAPGESCVKCHSDHNGADFQMVHWNPTARGFDHSKTGFTLSGKHGGVSCRACHTAQHIPAQARALLAGKDLNRTWMGLSPNCGTCHADPHRGRLGDNCTTCHSTADWNATSFDTRTFDHSRTQFPLTGEHRRVACKSCHTPGNDGKPRYEGLKFAYCADCHRDPHKGEFKQACETCHTTSSWTETTFVSKFDHSKTGFPLRGKHQAVPCLKCHVDANFKQPIAHAACADCHKPDPHNGQFAERADGGRCESCHTEQGWSPSTFSAADHAKTFLMRRCRAHRATFQQGKIRNSN